MDPVMPGDGLQAPGPLPAQSPGTPPPVGVAEILDRDGQVRQTVPVLHWPLSVGRALTNTLVLGDPHVAAQHLCIEPSGDELVLHAGDTRNGVRLGGRLLRAGETAALPAAGAPIELTVGRTRLRLRLPGQALAPEEALIVGTRTRRLAPMLVAAVAVLAAMAFGTWLASDPDNLARALGGALFAAVAAAAVWCSLWALLSKTFTRQGRFGWHLKVFVFASLAWTVLGALPPLAAFAFDWPAVADFGFVGGYLVGGVALYFHLLAVEPARPRLMRWVGGVAAVAGIALTLWFNVQRSDRLGEDLYMSHLYPPVLRLAPAMPVDAFIDGLAPLQAVLDRKAKEEGRGDAGAGDEE
jgi:hypothetical protein